jgi:uncharacterized alkaline shock family protein YloU
MHLLRETEHGRVSITSDAIAQIVGHVLAESYGVIATTGPRVLPRVLRERSSGVSVRAGDKGLEIGVRIVVEYGLNLAEIAATIRSRIVYEVERQTTLPVAAVDVRIDDARTSP